MTLNLSDVGFESQSRQTRLTIMPLGDIRAQYSRFLEEWQKDFSISLLERFLVTLSLKGTASDNEVMRGWITARILPRFSDYCAQLLITAQQHEYASAVFERIMKMWMYPPYNNPSLIIYSADVSRYVDDAMIIEVQYRDEIPTQTTPPLTGTFSRETI